MTCDRMRWQGAMGACADSEGQEADAMLESELTDDKSDTLSRSIYISDSTPSGLFALSDIDSPVSPFSPNIES